MEEDRYVTECFRLERDRGAYKMMQRMSVEISKKSGLNVVVRKCDKTG